MYVCVCVCIVYTSTLYTYYATATSELDVNFHGIAAGKRRAVDKFCLLFALVVYI